MNFIFVVALNNATNAYQYKTITGLFRTLAITLEELGHQTHIVCHPDSILHAQDYTKTYLTEFLNGNNYQTLIEEIGFTPDYAFIWNGNPPYDEVTIKLLQDNKIKIVYGELGFFKHFNKTCYFDLSGVNCKIRDIIDPLNEPITEDDLQLVELLKEDNIQPRLIEEPYIFIPLQIETDTQIVKYSPFKTMDKFLTHVAEIFNGDNRKIVFKQHPLKSSPISSYDKFVEVTEDVHHYIPYADLVVGINSTVLMESLIYHNRIISFGASIASRQLSEEQRIKLLAKLQRKQVNWEDLKDKDKVENSRFYQEILEDYSK
jgi:hypothetical protein